MEGKRCKIMIKLKSKDKFRALGNWLRINRKKEQACMCWGWGRAERDRQQDRAGGEEIRGGSDVRVLTLASEQSGLLGPQHSCFTVGTNLSRVICSPFYPGFSECF